jgi:hypothetical protein
MAWLGQCDISNWLFSTDGSLPAQEQLTTKSTCWYSYTNTQTMIKTGCTDCEMLKLAKYAINKNRFNVLIVLVICNPSWTNYWKTYSSTIALLHYGLFVLQTIKSTNSSRFVSPRETMCTNRLLFQLVVLVEEGNANSRHILHTTRTNIVSQSRYTGFNSPNSA